MTHCAIQLTKFLETKVQLLLSYIVEIQYSTILIIYLLTL